MKKSSIQFQPLPEGTDFGAPVRQAFRCPVSDKDNVLAILRQKTYSLANVSATGIAVYSDSCLDFENGEILEDTELLLGTQRLSGLTGKVVHCSVNASGSLHFGIEWLNLDDENREILYKILAKMKVAVLDENRLSHDPPGE